MRYNSAPRGVHLLCAEGSEAFKSVQTWAHGPGEGELNRLRLPYRVMLGEQGFDVHVSQLQLENVTRCMRRTRRMPNARSARVRAGADASRSQGRAIPAVRGSLVAPVEVLAAVPTFFVPVCCYDWAEVLKSALGARGRS